MIFLIFFNSLNIVKSQCCYQTIKEQCIYNYSLSDHEWWPRLPLNMAVATSQTWKLVKKISKKIENYWKNSPNKVFSSPVWAIAITWRPSKLFQKSSPLKPLGQFKPNLAWIILRGFHLKLCPMTLLTNHHGHHVY